MKNKFDLLKENHKYELTLHILHFLNSVVMGLNRFLEAVNNLFSPTFLPPGFVVLLAPAFQGSGVIT